MWPGSASQSSVIIRYSCVARMGSWEELHSGFLPDNARQHLGRTRHNPFCHHRIWLPRVVCPCERFTKQQHTENELMFRKCFNQI